MPSKALHRFDQRIGSFDADLELSDILIRNFLELSNSDHSVCEAISGRSDTYPRLNSRKNTRQSRNIVGLHLNRTIYVAFIKEIYEEFSEFLGTSLSRAALAGVDAARFAGEVKLDLHAKEILQAGSWENVIRLISDKIFRALENERNTKLLINKMSSRIGLQLEDHILTAAMPYLDARHILVHRDGRPDDLYLHSYPNTQITNGEITLNYDFIRGAREHVRTLAEHIDVRMIEANLVRRQDMVGQR